MLGFNTSPTRKRGIVPTPRLRVGLVFISPGKHSFLVPLLARGVFI